MKGERFPPRLTSPHGRHERADTNENRHRARGGRCRNRPEGTAMSDAPSAGYRTWMCLICGWMYEEEKGLPDEEIAPGTRWEDIPINWTCPECGARKEDFEMVEI